MPVCATQVEMVRCPNPKCTQKKEPVVTHRDPKAWRRLIDEEGGEG